MAQVNGDCGIPSGWPKRVCGVWGDCGPNRGVIGSSRANTGVRGESLDTIGVFGVGGVYGVSGESTGRGSDADPRVYAGVHGSGGDIGVFGESPNIAGLFKGLVYIDGSLIVVGAKSAVVRDAGGTLRQLYAVESPEAWFEDVGRSEMVDGYARVQLEEGFASLIGNDYHVFLTPEGPCSGLFVSARQEDGFEVAEVGGSTVTFSYRVVGRRGDVEAARLAPVDMLWARSDLVTTKLEEGHRPGNGNL